ncbi:Acetyltransferase, GNAT family [Granulibacter bethesdensis]|uniref:Acetyltransferase, GNAT family n=2 Tax=Granulibacter bethesdensis TaxID=364410 RepID=A0AAN0VG07_9PROT|nr:Acetyltransferase, GNAT family [Granulibacter bethesdensis]APH59783.1 Acetyltransferase, GNAT family [Granulibacter bethesdensis]
MEQGRHLAFSRSPQYARIMSQTSSSSPSLRIETLSGEALVPVLPALAHLRLSVFRTWPYLYDGDQAYEQRYLQTYVRSPGAGVVLAWDGARAVGASTCLPMVEEEENVSEPFRKRGWDPARFFYFGESVLLPEYRGCGVGVAFFREREAHAKRVSNCDYATFCSVKRPENHPSRPADWVPLHEFWTRRGFTPFPSLTCRMSWKDVGEADETEKELTFWIKSLSGTPLPEENAI